MRLTIIPNSSPHHDAKHLCSMMLDNTPWEQTFSSVMSDAYSSIIVLQIVARVIGENNCWHRACHTLYYSLMGYWAHWSQICLWFSDRGILHRGTLECSSCYSWWWQTVELDNKTLFTMLQHMRILHGPSQSCRWGASCLMPL